MPPAEAIRLSAFTIANQWQSVAVAWHAVLGVAALAYVAGWRPSRRLAAIALLLPMASVSATAWAAGNPFNGGVFAVVVAALIVIAIRLAPTGIQPRTAIDAWLGAVFVVVGALYPHFLLTASPLEYLYASPFGLLPCPTLLVIAGVSIAFGAFDSRGWWIGVAGTAVLYGVIGVLVLGVAIDVMLITAGLVLAWRGHAAEARVGVFSGDAEKRAAA